MSKAKKVYVQDIHVTVTYKVGLGNIEMPEIVKKQLIKASENLDEIDMHSSQYPNAADWLNNNIKEKDCFDWKAEIDNISE